MILSGCSGCSQPVNPQPSQVVILPTSTQIPTKIVIPSNTAVPIPTNTPAPTQTPIPTHTPIPTVTNTPTITPTTTPIPRVWTYEQRQLFWSQSGAGVILFQDNYIPDSLIPFDKESTTAEELWSWEIPADYLCEWLYNQIISGIAFPEFEDREFVWESSANWLGYADKEPYCPQFDLNIGFNP